MDGHETGTRLAVTATALATGLLWLWLGTQPTIAADAPGWVGDYRSFYLPNAEYAGERLARGELPLWNPHQGAGAPFLATLQPGALYPPNWLHALLPAQTAFVVLAWLHVTLAAAFAGALAAAFGAGPAGSALAGLAYATSMQVLGNVWSPPVLYASAWAPALLLAVDRAFARPDARCVVGIAFAVAAGLLAGWPYTLAIVGLGAALYALGLATVELVRTRRLPIAALALLALGAGAGAALAAPQLLPSAELLARSCRALGSLVEVQAIGGGVNRPYEPALFWKQLTLRGFNDGIPGWPTLALASLAVALPGAGRGRTLLLLAAGALGLLASFPNHTPVYGWLRELPLYADFRFPFRYRILTGLSLAVAAGVGLGHLQRALRGRPRAALAAGAAALALQLGLASLPYFRILQPFARSWPPARSVAGELEREAGAAAWPAADAWSRFYWAERADKLRAPDGSTWALHDLEPLHLARTAELLTFFETGRPLTLLTLPDRVGGLPTPKGDAIAPPFFGHLRLPLRGDRARVLDLFSVGTVVAPSPPAWLEERYRRRSPPGAELAVFENAAGLPRAYRVEHAVAEPAALRAGLAQLVAPGFDPRRSVMLDAPPRALLSARPQPPGDVEITAYEPERVVLRTRGTRPGIVVLTDAHYPGWQARLDGNPVPILRANLAFRAVAVPAGDHEIVLRYRPTRFGGALALSLFVLVALVVLVVLATRRRLGDPRTR